MGLLGWLVLGLFAGMVARLLVPGNQHLGCIGTSLLGVAGSLVGGTIFNAVTGDGFELKASGFIGAVFGAALLLVLGRVFGGGGGGRGRPRRFEDDLDVRRRR